MTPDEQRAARLRMALVAIVHDTSVYDARRTALNALAVDDRTTTDPSEGQS